MGLTLYKGNKNKTGSLGDFSFNAKDRALYITLVRQTSYDEGKRLAGFKDGEKLNLKFTIFEIGAILRSIKNVSPLTNSLFHKSATKTTVINFGPYNKKVDGKPTDEIIGFGLRCNIEADGEKTSFSLALNLDEAEAVSEYLKYGLTHIFNAIYSEDKKRAEEYQSKKDAPSTKKPETAPEPKVDQEPASEDVDF